MIITDWLTQVRRGLLEYCILTMIQKSRMYGYDLITQLNSWDFFSVAAGTIYPLLKRLEKEGLITSEWESSAEGTPAKKFYVMTDLGNSLLEEMDDEWVNVVESIKQIKEGGLSK